MDRLENLTRREKERLTEFVKEAIYLTEEVCPLSARMVVNQVSMKRESERIARLIKGLQELLREDEGN